jgi:hypothetical protein
VAVADQRQDELEGGTGQGLVKDRFSQDSANVRLEGRLGGELDAGHREGLSLPAVAHGSPF